MRKTEYIGINDTYKVELLNLFSTTVVTLFDTASGRALHCESYARESEAKKAFTALQRDYWKYTNVGKNKETI